jgi:hypothetical protein
MRCAKVSTAHYEFALWLLAAALFIAGPLVAPVRAQQPLPIGPPQPETPVSRVPPYQYTSDEIVGAGHQFFGRISKGIALVVQKAAEQWGEPKGYILGEEGGGAFIGGLRYGDGTLYTKNAGDLRVFWQGPTIGVDLGADGARTMMLVYNLPRTDAIYEQFNGIAGAAYAIAGFGMTALTSGDETIVVVPIRSRLGLRLGYNVGYLKFTSAPTWNPF